VIEAVKQLTNEYPQEIVKELLKLKYEAERWKYRALKAETMLAEIHKMTKRGKQDES